MIIQIDPSGWTQEQQNMTTAMIVKMLYDSGINHQGIQVNFPNVIVFNSSADITNVITKAKVEAEYTKWQTDVAVKVAQINAIRAARQAEYDTSPFVTTPYDNIDAAINNITNLAELKTFLKTFVKAIRFKLIDKIR